MPSRASTWAMPWPAPGRPTQAKPTAVSNVAGVVNGKLRAVRRLTGHELPFLKAHCRGAIKMTLPSATQFPAIAFKRGITDKVYADHAALLRDIVEIVKVELQALAAEGVAYIQIDAPRYSYYLDPKWREWLRSETGSDPHAAARPGHRRRQRLLRRRSTARACCSRFTCAAATTAATGTPRAATTRSPRSCSAACAWTASCWSTTTSAPVASSRFASCRAARPSCSGSSARSCPSSKSPTRSPGASRRPPAYVPLEHLALSPQCGFASTMEGNLHQRGRAVGQAAARGGNGPKDLGLRRPRRGPRAVS